MRVGQVVWFILLAILSGFTFGQVKPVILAIPKGFEGPISASHQSAEVEGYVKKIQGSERGTLIQVTSYDFGPQLSGMPPEKRSEVAKYYLAQFLAGVERSRTSYQLSESTEITLGGIPAVMAEWKGSSSGFDMYGVMYCVIVGTKVVSLHTQGFSDSPPEDRQAAIAAIESVKFTQ